MPVEVVQSRNDLINRIFDERHRLHTKHLNHLDQHPWRCPRAQQGTRGALWLQGREGKSCLQFHAQTRYKAVTCCAQDVVGMM